MTGPPADLGQYVDAVEAIVELGSYQHIIPMSDATLRRAYLEDRPWTRRVFPRVARDRLELLLDKRRTCEFAAAHGVLTPAIRGLDGADGLSRAARDYLLPNAKPLRLREMANLEPQKRFKGPCSVRIDDQGRMYVADHGCHRIQVYQKEAYPLTAEEIMPVPRSPTLQTA